MQTLKFSIVEQIIHLVCPARMVIADTKKHVFAEFELDNEWNGLSVTVVFSNDYSAPYSVPLTTNPMEIPPEVLVPGSLRVSLVGLRDNGEYRLTTKFMDRPIIIHRAGDLIGLQPEEASPELWEQVLALIGDVSSLDTSDKSSLVAAINELYATGGNSGAVSPDMVAALIKEYLSTTPLTSAQVGAHNTDTASHADIRLLIDGLAKRLNALADSDDTTLDQMSELVAYIKDNRELIDQVTTGKVSVTDIVNNLVTNVASKPLSAAQGVVLKTLIDALQKDKLSADALSAAVESTLKQAKESGEFDGEDGSDANVTAENIEAALGYKPASEDDIPTTLKNPYPLTINGTEYDGSKKVEMIIEGGGSGGAEPDWNAAEGEPGYVKNRTHWIDFVEETLFDETITISGYKYYDAALTLPLVEGETYTVRWNGTDYECTCVSFANNGQDVVAIGNVYMFDQSAANTGEPFFIACIPFYNATQFVCYQDGDYSVEIIGTVKQYVQLPPEFIPPSLPYYIELESPDGLWYEDKFTTTATQEEVVAALVNGYQVVARYKDVSHNRFLYYAYQESKNNGSLTFSKSVCGSRNDTPIPVIIELEFTPNIEGGYDISTKSAAAASTDDIPETRPNPYALTINGTSYDGSKAVEMTIEGGSGDSVPDYVRTEAERVAKVVQSRQNANTITFLACSDIHYSSPDNASPIASAQNQYEAVTHMGQAMGLIREKVHIDFAAMLGDMIWDATETADEALAEVRFVNEQLSNGFGSLPQFRSRGNHENGYDSGANFTNDQVYANIGAFNRDNVGDSENRVGGYCYRDFDAVKLRVICLNSSEAGGCLFSAQQVSWLTNALDLSEKGDDWCSIILSHHPLDWGKSGGVDPTATINSAYGVIGAFHGHIHNFKVDTIKNTTIKRIAIPNACYGLVNTYDTAYDIDWSEDTSYPKTENTAQDTSFCVVTIDLEAQKIYADHYGAGYSREIDYTVKSAGPGYDNLVPESKTKGGSAIYGEDYNGDGTPDGYKNGAYCSDAGADGNDAAYVATGFTPYNKETIYIKSDNAVLDTTKDRVRWYAYYPDFSTGHSIKGPNISTWFTIETPEMLGKDYYKLTPTQTNIDAGGSTSWYRLSLYGTGEGLTITHNQPIE